MPYDVVAADNYHPHDPAEQREIGTFETADEAIEAAKRVIDASLAGCRAPGIGADTLFEHFRGFGEITFIFHPGTSAPPDFDPWAYARDRAVAMTREWPARGD